MLKKVFAICLITHNRVEQLRKTLDNIEFEFGSQVDLFILNNGSTDDTRIYLDSNFAPKSSCQVFHSHSNLGVARGRELLWAQVKTPYILSLDDDVVISKQTADVMIRVIDDNRSSALVSPDIIDSSSGEVINKQNLSLCNLPTFYEACFLLRRQVINEIGPFDSNLLFAGEGLDFALRLQNFGYEISRVNAVSVIHYDRERTKSETRVRRQQWLWSFCYVYRKNLKSSLAIYWTFRTLIAHIRTGHPIFGWKYTLGLTKFAFAGYRAGYLTKRDR